MSARSEFSCTRSNTISEPAAEMSKSRMTLSAGSSASMRWAPVVRIYSIATVDVHAKPMWHHKSVIVLFQIVLRLSIDLIALTALGFRQRRATAAEILVLRRQVALYQSGYRCDGHGGRGRSARMGGVSTGARADDAMVGRRPDRSGGGPGFQRRGGGAYLVCLASTAYAAAGGTSRAIRMALLISSTRRS
jgi:hypothetical protein